MNKERKAELCDKIILKFAGNASIPWHDLHGPRKRFNDIVLDSDCNKDNPSELDKYYVIEPLINLLVADGILRRNETYTSAEYLNLTDQGYATYSDLKNLGYVTKSKEASKENNWKIASRYIAIATLGIVITRFIIDFIFPGPQTKNPPQTETIQKKDTLSLDTSLRVNQINKDSLTIQNLKKKK